MDQPSLRDDLAFLRSSIERQRRFEKAVFTPWFAVTMSACIFVICLLRDMPFPGSHSITQAILWLIPAAAAFLPWYELRRRGDLPNCTWTDAFSMLFPWVACATAIVAFSWIASDLSITPLQSLQIASLMIALTAIMLGSAGSLTYLFAGLGLALGVVAMRVVPGLGWTLYGAFIALGLTFGAIRENRIARE